MANQERTPVSGQYLEYLGKPLVREGDTICYGDMNEKCILIMEILSYKDKDGKHLPDKIMIQLRESSTGIPKEQKVLNGLKVAFDYADAWLERFNK